MPSSVQFGDDTSPTARASAPSTVPTPPASAPAPSVPLAEELDQMTVEFELYQLRWRGQKHVFKIRLLGFDEQLEVFAAASAYIPAGRAWNDLPGWTWSKPVARALTKFLLAGGPEWAIRLAEVHPTLAEDVYEKMEAFKEARFPGSTRYGDAAAVEGGLELVPVGNPDAPAV